MSALEREEHVEEIWSRFAQGLTGWFRSRLPSPADAEDLLQETFLRIQVGLSSRNDPQRLSAWVWTIARNVLFDHLRDKGRETEELADGGLVEDSEASPETEQIVASWLRPMIAELDDKDREALELSELQGLTAREIAERTGLSVSGVKSRVQRGRDKLRAELVICCRFEFDRRNRIIDYEKRSEDGCDAGACGS